MTTNKSFSNHKFYFVPLNSTTSTLSVGSTGSQARLIQSSHAPSHYQPVLMKDLGKKSSITDNHLTSFKPIDAQSPASVGNDDEHIVDKHLNELKKNHSSFETHDVAKFMEKLKIDQRSYESSESTDRPESDKPIALKPNKEPPKPPKRIDSIKTTSQPDDKDKRQQPNGNIKMDQIQVKPTRKSSLSPQGSVRKPKTIDIDASSSSGDNPVHIVKVRSPRGSRASSLSRENSRSNSAERDKAEKATIKKPEAGILKKPSPKFDKANFLKTPEKLRPDRFISPCSSFDSKSDKLSPSSEILPNICVTDPNTMQTSFSDHETRSRDRRPQSPKSRSLDCSLEHLKSALKTQSNYENVTRSSSRPNSRDVSPRNVSPRNVSPRTSSPDRRNLDPNKYYNANSARSSFDSTRSPIRYCSPNPGNCYYNEPFYEYPAHGVRGGPRKRESRSLERPAYMRQGSSDYERYYEAPPDVQYRRHSTYDYQRQPHPGHQHYYSQSPDDYLAQSYEPSCIDCYYQTYHHHYPVQPPPLPQRNQPLPAQSKPVVGSSAARQRQSRSRKKLTRRMSANSMNNFNKSFDDDDANDEIHV